MIELIQQENLLIGSQSAIADLATYEKVFLLNKFNHKLVFSLSLVLV